MRVRIVHRNGTERTVESEGLRLEGKSPSVRLRYSYAGMYEGSLTHGWLESPADSWRIADADLERLRQLAKDAGTDVWPMPRSPGRPRQPKGPPRVHPKQTKFEGGGLLARG